MKALKKIAACAAVASIALFAWKVTSPVSRTDQSEIEKPALHDTLPPGFVLVTNQNGEWRAAIENPFVVCDPYFDQEPGRQAAIERAWGQYEYEENRKRQKWTRAE